MKTLFDQTTIKNMTMKNRFIRSALWEMLADEKGHMTDALFTIYQDLAEGGVGTILTGYAYITEDEQPNPNMMGMYDDSFIPEYKKLTDMAHENDANIIMQLVYGGSQTGLTPPSKVILGPSAIQNEVSGVTPKEMTQEDMDYVIRKFADAAERAQKAGFDGVELHGAHGYLLSQFMSPRYNQRTDVYGGSIENRSRLLIEVYEAVRQRVGDAFPIWVKINAEDFAEDGMTAEESRFVAKKLAALGLDAIEISGGTESVKSVVENNLTPARTKIMGSKDKESYFRDYAAKLAEEVDMPVILVGGNRHFDVMDTLLNETNIAYFSLARPLTAEPDLINKWAGSEAKKKTKCVSCNACYYTPGKRCILNIREAEKNASEAKK